MRKHASLHSDFYAMRAAVSRMTAAWHRLEVGKARIDMREWTIKRRERTRHLIERGGLVVKAGPVDLAMMIAPHAMAHRLSARSGYAARTAIRHFMLRKRKGRRAFESEQREASDV